jgi:predicted ATPase
MGLGAADIAEIVPELRSKLPDLESPPVLEPDQARFRLFDSITTFLKNAAKSQPLLLILDDLHWADHSSLLLLEFLAREIQSIPLLVLGTYRDVEVSRRHPLSETLGSLIREQHFLRVQLPGLAEPEVEQLIQRAAAFSLPPGLSATIHQRTEGNPLFVTEIIRMLAVEGIGEGMEQGQVPEGVRDAIGRRLNRLSEGCNQILTTASVIGREFDFKLQKALSGEIPEERLLALVDEAIEGHIIEELPQTVGRYQFTHALIQETLTAELTLTRRVRLHGRIAEALEELYGSAAGAHAAELAHHFAQAESVLGPEKLARYSLLAGEQALAHPLSRLYVAQAIAC